MTHGAVCHLYITVIVSDRLARLMTTVLPFQVHANR